MFRKDIAHALPEGVGQPLLSRVLTGTHKTPWVRAGEIRREERGVVFKAQWDGEGFQLLWEVACSTEVKPEAQRVEFAIRGNRGLHVIATVNLDPRLTRQVSDAQRRAHAARRRLLHGNEARNRFGPGSAG